MPNWVRKKECPFCGSRTAFAIDTDQGGYICHSCDATGHIGQLKGDFDHDLNIVRDYPDKRYPGKYESDKPSALSFYNGFYTSKAGGLTDDYLSKRGISYSMWGDLGLREGSKWGYEYLAVYPFFDMYGGIKALHTTRFKLGQREKRYYGKKSQGVAILKKAPICIIAEGLENALIIRQKHPEAGVVIAGDCGNLKRYASDHHGILAGIDFICAVDGDKSGSRAFNTFANTFNVIRFESSGLNTDAVDQWS